MTYLNTWTRFEVHQTTCGGDSLCYSLRLIQYDQLLAQTNRLGFEPIGVMLMALPGRRPLR